MSVIPSIDLGALRVTAIGSAVLFARFLGVATCELFVKLEGGQHPPEDHNGVVPYLTDKKQSLGVESVEKTKSETVARWNRIILNDLENIPFGVTMMWAGLICAGDPKVHQYAVGAFVASRVIYSFAYALKFSKTRTFAWASGVVAVGTIIGNALSGVYKM
eukprot:CAMPEP_0182443754 /NCGR_PEP_ID=MMETSP1172-20130603/2397_1 /TAXON_ID=708627 /ORGANISM="Timspurckia oligopyrenoides, Strain CCMP3278" /LENGTH=160 /DNA_ID=CAMNT_0024639119 /DNA_START=43 /DNA_END=525 /DNA_ORIENTATION=+